MNNSVPGSSFHYYFYYLHFSPGKHTGVGSYSLLQGIFPTPGSGPGLPQARSIFYHLRHQGSPLTHIYICLNVSYLKQENNVLLYYIDIFLYKNENFRYIANNNE